MNVKIIADSACDLSKDYYIEYGIEMVPLNVHLDNKDYADVKEIDPKTIYDKMRNGKAPKTSQPAPEAFKKVFTASAEKNEPLVYVSFSSELSGTYQSAKIMEDQIKTEYPDAPIHVIDSKCASLGYGLVVLHIAKMAKDGAAFAEIIEAAEHQANHMEHIFTVDDLEYLYRGGRVSKTSAFVGSLLKIKPILNVEDGKLIPLEKLRGSKKVLGRMIELMEERGKDFRNQTIGISHGDDLERAEQLASLIQEKFDVPKENIVIEMVGAVIGAHSGPGTLALFFSNQPNI
ncbi:DegV family protein [Oceanobacillus alkalisoli]|uniref:DegV family protein n=1 Tax=Oceanobacillus alkalisoli TaxID=2925113 RepID=UPI001EF1360C|nr:DegV family protein [Oceanobacillus alkalisoli]MCF3942056.1 DegV family protein [Oceanobacillus alkalisoli]MCG5101991.1 DegV family protein [Oceanobacillus alkalisoli]